MEIVAKIALIILLVMPALLMTVAVATLWHGYVLSVLWGWFAVPIFGLPALPLSHAIGVTLVVTFLTHHKDWNAAEDEDKKWTPAVMLFLSPAVTLFAGWIVKHYI